MYLGCSVAYQLYDRITLALDVQAGLTIASFGAVDPAPGKELCTLLTSHKTPENHRLKAVLADAFARPGSRAGTAYGQPPTQGQMRLGTAVAPSHSQMRLGTAIAPSYNQMRLGTAEMPGTARPGTAVFGDSTNRPMTSNKV